MRILMFFIFLFLLNCGVLLNAETCHGLSLQHIYKNLAAQSMFQAEPVLSLAEIQSLRNEDKIEKLENYINQAKRIVDLAKRDKELFKLFSMVDLINISTLNPNLIIRFFNLKLNLLIDLGLYRTGGDWFDYIGRDKIGLKQESVPIDVFQKNLELSDNPQQYIEQMHRRFDFLSSIIDGADIERSNLDLNLRIFIRQCFAKEWNLLAKKNKNDNKELALICEFESRKQSVYLIRYSLIKGDYKLLRETIMDFSELYEISLFPRSILMALPSIFRNHEFNFKEIYKNIVEFFTIGFKQREEGFLYLEQLFGCLPQNDKLRMDFFDFIDGLRRDSLTSFSYEYAYEYISFFLGKESYPMSKLILSSVDDFERVLTNLNDKKDKVFLFYLLIAIKSKDINKYKIALDNLKKLINSLDSVNYSDMYMNLFVSVWNTYKEQPGFVINPMVTEINIACEGLIQRFYEKEMSKVAWFWNNFDKEIFQSSILVPDTEFLPSEGKDVNIVGDIHGEINGIIFPLVSRDLIHLTGNVILWDLKTRQQAFQMSTTCVFLPEVQILSGKENEIWQFLGDIVDKGKFTDECIAFLDYLFKKEPRLLNNIHIVFGNHEFNLLTNGGSVIPSYSGRNFLLVKEIIRSWINEDFLQYSFVANGWLYTHSFVSINFLIKFYKELDELRGVIDPDLIDRAKIAINWFLNDKAEEGLPEQIGVALYERPNLDFNSEAYKENINILDRILNQVFIYAFQTEINSCLFDQEISPMWARQSVNVNPCPNIKNGFGHIPLINVRSFGGGRIIVGAIPYRNLVDYDCLLSYGMLLFGNNPGEEISSHCKYNLGRNCVHLNVDQVYFRSGFMKDFKPNIFAQTSILEDLKEIQSAQEEIMIGA